MAQAMYLYLRTIDAMFNFDDSIARALSQSVQQAHFDLCRVNMGSSNSSNRIVIRFATGYMMNGYRDVFNLANTMPPNPDVTADLVRMIKKLPDAKLLMHVLVDYMPATALAGL